MSSAPNLTLQPAAPAAAGNTILGELEAFVTQCEVRYRFNNRWDVVLTVSAVLLGVGIVAAGTYDAAKVASILGAFITAIVGIQRAFPFGQRAQFYRSLVGQATNLQTDLLASLTTVEAAATTLKNLRLDYAQQLPRGNTSGSPTPTDGK